MRQLGYGAELSGAQEDDVARGAGGERESVVLGRGDGVVAEVLDEQLKNSEGL
jgi:hypothetical protein